MGFSIAEYADLRPFLYHVTDRANVARLQRQRRLDPAIAVLRAARREDLIRERRSAAVPLLVDGETIVLKDQHPLIAANVALDPRWQFGDFVQYLNELVYFWPGDALTAIAPGGRLLDHYAADRPAVIRVRFLELLQANPGLEPLFSPYNSGAPRMRGGQPVPRGPDLFRSAFGCPRRRHEVVEVGFRGSVIVPPSTEIAVTNFEWERLVNPAA